MGDAEHRNAVHAGAIQLVAFDLHLSFSWAGVALRRSSGDLVPWMKQFAARWSHLAAT